MAAARPRGDHPDLRRTAVRLRVLASVFSQPVIRELGVVVVDEDRSETSRAFVEQVAASPSLGIVERAGDLASTARAIRAGRRHCRGLHPGQFRARPEGRAAAAGRRILQSAVPDGRGRGGVGSERQPGRRRQRGVRGPRGTDGVPHRGARRRDDRAGQPAEELRAVSAACAACRWSSMWSSRLPPATRSAPSSAGAACAPGSPARAVTRSLRSRASLRPCSRSSSSSCCRRRSFWKDCSKSRSRATCR